MAGSGKKAIAYSFSEILNDNESLGGTFFSSRLRVDTSDVRCVIPTICLQLAARKYLPSLSRLILDVVEDNPDCKSWKIGKQFQNFIVKPLTTAFRDAIKLPVIVLDALDECSDQSLVTELLSLILKHSISLPVKFFITSRPEIRLKESFVNAWTHSNFIVHEIEKEIVKANITSSSSRSDAPQASKSSSDSASWKAHSRSKMFEFISSGRPSPFAPSPFSPSLFATSAVQAAPETAITISCGEGATFPKTIKSDKNIEVLTAWKSITSRPKFKVCFFLQTSGYMRRVLMSFFRTSISVFCVPSSPIMHVAMVLKSF